MEENIYLDSMPVHLPTTSCRAVTLQLSDGDKKVV